MKEGTWIESPPQDTSQIALCLYGIITFHDKVFSKKDSKNQISKIKFGKYEREGKQVGFSYSVNKENKEDSTSNTSFIIGFTFGEARLLKQYLMKALDASFTFYTPKKEQNQNSGKPEESFDSW